MHSRKARTGNGSMPSRASEVEQTCLTLVREADSRHVSHLDTHGTDSAGKPKAEGDADRRGEVCPDGGWQKYSSLASKPKFCIDCIHCHKVERYKAEWLGCDLFWVGRIGKLNLVTGIRKKDGYLRECQALRSKNGKCGIEARLFEKKPDNGNRDAITSR